MDIDDTIPPPVVYTELIGAEIMGETKSKLAWICAFGHHTIFVPKSRTDVKDDNRIFVARSLAQKNVQEWQGAFIKGTQQTRMCAVDKTMQDTIEAVANTLIKAAHTLTQCAEMLKDALTKLG